MNLLILSHKPPYPIVDGGCHAMDRFVRDLLKTFPSAKIHYLCIATQKHPFQANEIPKDLSKQITFSAVEISSERNNVVFGFDDDILSPVIPTANRW